MSITYNIAIFPLLHIPLLLLVVSLFAMSLYRKAKLKNNFYLAIFGGVIFLYSLSLYLFNGQSEFVFWSTPYHLAAVSVLLFIVATRISEKRIIADHLPIIVLSLFICISLLIPIAFRGLTVAFAFLLYGLWLLYQYQQTNKGDLIFITFFLSLAVTIFCGQTLNSQTIAFFYSMLLVLLLIYETLQYFNRVVLIMRNAGIHSITDSLTGLLNKGYLLKFSKQLLHKNESICIIFSDIDNFKILNDEKGHDYGDQVLIKVGAILKNTLANKGYAFRYGGEEMVGIITKGEGALIAEKFREKVQSEIGITVSIGVANSSECDVDGDRNNLHMHTIRKADERMYKAKKMGKNKVIFED